MSTKTTTFLRLLINNPSSGIMNSQFLQFVAIATDPATNLFTALSVQPASQDQFNNQTITYHRGTELEQVICSDSTCQGKTLVFQLNGLVFNFLLSAQTAVLGFGQPAVIKAGQEVDAAVIFIKAQFSVVKQVTNPNPQT